MARSAFLDHPLRATGKLVWLAGELAWTALDYPLRRFFSGGRPVHEVRALWLQRHCRRVRMVLNVRPHVTGPVPSQGLLASNHLSYMDIILLGSITPSVFVAKREVREWPLFGWFAHLGGTVFVHRERKSDALRSSNEIREALQRDSLVVIFPEGTSTGGRTVLPFKSALLREAENPEFPAYACCIRYHLPEGDAEEEVCFWRDMSLVPHLLNLLGRTVIEAKVSFAHLGHGHKDRKHLSRLLHREVLRMHSGAPAPIPMGWDEIITGYDFGLLTAEMILTWVRDSVPQGAAVQRLAALVGDELNFEEMLWAACQEATGSLPRPGTEKWGKAQDRWRKALLRDAYDPSRSPEDLGKVVEEIYERVGCPEDMRALWHHASPWENAPAIGHRDKIEAFLRES